MDDLLGAGRGPDLGLSGAVCRALDADLGRLEPMNSLLSAAYWAGATRTSQFADALDRFGVSAADAREVLVVHGQGTRFNLLVMSSTYRRVPQVLSLDLGADEVADAFRRAEAGGQSVLTDAVRRRYYVRRTMPDLGQAVREVAARGIFGAVLLQRPPELETCVPVPAKGVWVPGLNDFRATVGVVAARGVDRFVTTVRHALPDGVDEVHVDGVPGRVVTRDRTTDSCLIAVPDLPEAGPDSWCRLRRRVMPHMEQGHFNRVGWGRVLTVIEGADRSLFDAESDFPTRFYTTAETVPGDSGTALIDFDDCVVAFAVRRSSAGGRHPAFSTWVCATQTLGKLGVTL